MTWLQNLSPALQLLLVVVLIIVFKDQIVAFAKARLGLDNGVEINISAPGENVPEKSSKDWFNDVTEVMNNQERQLTTVIELMGGLSEHYNHETTDLLTKILEESKKTNAKLYELEKYGFPTRNESFRERTSRENGV